MAVGEAITNIAAASIEDISRIVLSANWMVPAGHPGEDEVPSLVLLPRAIKTALLILLIAVFGLVARYLRERDV